MSESDMSDPATWLNRRMRRSERTTCEHGALIRKNDCWRVTTASRAAVLVDAAAYFGALRESLLRAQRSIFIVGWDVDSRTRLVGPSGVAMDGFPEELGPLLVALVGRRPKLRINIVLWDYSMLYALEREPLPTLNLNWMTPRQISVCLDDQFPFASSHHQKVVVVDDATAFVGGIDLTIRRWDTRSHEPGSPARVDPRGQAYRPFHDVQIAVAGETAEALGRLVRARWQQATGSSGPRVRPTGDAWPEGVNPDFRNVPVAIARTQPSYRGHTEIREVEALYLNSIATAERTIYIECQYLTAASIVRSLTARLREEPDLEALIVGPNLAKGWLEDQSMSAGRDRFMQYLHGAGVADRVRLLYPCCRDGRDEADVFVHAKVMIVDDRMLRVGSSNLNNRSMGTDSECDLVVKGISRHDRATITRIRNELLAEHLDVDVDRVRRATEEHGSFLKAIDSLSGRLRTLRPVELELLSNEAPPSTIEQMADPERPILPPAVFGNLFGATSSNALPARWGRFLAMTIIVLAFVGLWRLTPLADLADPREMVAWLRAVGDGSLMPATVLLAYLVGGVTAFPVTVLVAVTGIMFDPLVAFPIALAGSLLSAVLTFQLGHLIGDDALRGIVGPKVSRVFRALASRGILSIMAIRMLPIAPFTLINLAAGAIHIRLKDFVLGTALGMLPGILILTFLGYQFAESLTDPAPVHVMIFALGLLVLFSLGLAVQRFTEKSAHPPE